MYVWAPVIAGVLLSLASAVLFYAEFEPLLPHSLRNETEWLALAESVSAHTHANSLPARLGVLLALHALHIYACLPMLHLTKVLYGMWLGLARGWLACCAWELLLFLAYLGLMPRHCSHVLLLYTQRSRSAGHILFDNAMMAMSSFPLHVSAALVLNANVSVREFLLANALVTSVLSLKNVWCGVVLASSPLRPPSSYSSCCSPCRPSCPRRPPCTSRARASLWPPRRWRRPRGVARRRARQRARWSAWRCSARRRRRPRAQRDACDSQQTRGKHTPARLGASICVVY